MPTCGKMLTPDMVNQMFQSSDEVGGDANKNMQGIFKVYLQCFNPLTRWGAMPTDDQTLRHCWLVLVSIL